METLRNKVRTKKNRYWTLVVIPASQEKVNNFKLPCWLLRGILAFSVIGMLTGLYFYFSYRFMQDEIAALTELKVVNQLQEEEIKRLQYHAAEMEQKIQAVQNLDKQVRELVGLKSDSSPGGATTLSSRSAQGGGMGERETRITLLGLREEKETVPAAEEGMLTEETKSVSDGLMHLKQLDHVLAEIEAQADYQINNLEKLQQEVTARLQFLEALPNHWPLAGKLSSRFGYRRSPFGNAREFHDGIDIANQRGTVLTAAGAGKVVFTGWKTGYGLTVIIDHGYGYSTLYGHNSSVMVKVGQTVKKGTPIGKVGSTGRSTGPHLHFTILKNGKPIDPLKVLQ
ncbi:MAG: M23 family metallopeptidase [Bacillota bacterium]